MSISYTEAVILYGLMQINAERSIYSLCHLFQGKKSSQTIQDAHLFKLTSLFQSIPFFTRGEIEETIASLENKRLLVETRENHFNLTREGSFLVEQFRMNYALPPKYLAGWKYHHLTTVFWERLSLLIQVCSNLIYFKKGFLPVQNKLDIQEWVKAYLKNKDIDRYQLSQHLYHELVSCLEQEQKINPSVLIIRLTGHGKIGLTSVQAADTLRMERTQYQLEFLNTLHFLLGNLSNSQDYPYLSEMIAGVDKLVPFTLSTKKTYELIQKGYMLNEIARMRQLKMNTIEDHVVEIALHLKDFDIRPYVSLQKEERIIKVIQELSTKKLRHIRERVDDATYFEIRLVLARNGDR